MEQRQGKHLQDTAKNYSPADGTGDHVPTQSGNNLLPDIFLDLESHDSGHFTVTPDIEHRPSGGSGGSSRDQSPTSILHGHSENPTTTSLAAHLVLQVCRDGQSGESRGEGNIAQSLPTKYAYSGHNISTKSVKFNHDNNDLNEHDIVSPSSPTSVGFLKTTLDNFNALYQEKLQMIEDVGAQGDTATKQSLAEKKANILECWAKDVCVQNIVLIHTVEELEKQGIEKMRTLQQKISESTNLMKKHKIVVDSYEERINGLLKEKVVATEIHKALKQDLDKIKTEYKRIRGRVNQLEKDNDSLVSLVTRIRDMGIWDVGGLEFHKRTFSQIFELYPHLPGSEVQTVFTREKAKQIRENEDTVEKLEFKVAELQNFQSNASLSIERKDSTISELEAEVNRVVGKLQQCQEECDHYKKSLIETQEMLLHTTKELQERINSPSNHPNDSDSARHAEIQELLQELRNVKDQLNISVRESQSAKEETNMIRREFSDRLRTMQESQQCLQSEFSHSFDTHQLVREKQLELDKTKEEAQTYQAKCETTAMQLDKKDKIIEELQSTIKQLNNKIIDIKDEWNRIFSNIDQPTPSREPVLISKMSENGLPDSVSVTDKANVEKERLGHQFEMEKLQLVEDFTKQLKDKDIEITMQKVTIQHLQNSLVAMKRGQPFPVPDSSNNANGINGGKVFEI
ncbi:uncharacterized protein LOC110860430 isoform X3 [Folsomia candida]|uniref:uncharacterized protein LOC110860430 isoform X3 n=1 Tax=Folsomia candida TaxID=158441 RepID=UPI000B8F22FE|nr:uncharacterized protein LOC110860430 isoform X3 [Folsomia candida]